MRNSPVNQIFKFFLSLMKNSFGTGLRSEVIFGLVFSAYRWSIRWTDMRCGGGMISVRMVEVDRYRFGW